MMTGVQHEQTVSSRACIIAPYRARCVTIQAVAKKKVREEEEKEQNVDDGASR